MSGPILMVGLDAADFDLVRRLAEENLLPVLAGLMRRGCVGELRGNAGLFAGGVWPTFYTGRDVPWHGLYHNKLWRQERMRCEIADAGWFPVEPFWETLPERYRVAVLDVPMTVAAPKPINGLSLAGWGTHDVIARGAWPTSLWGDLVRSHGRPRMPAELFGSQTAGSLSRLARDLVDATSQMAAIGADLLGRGEWDLFLLVFGATHRGGHYLWDLSQIDRDRLSADRAAVLERRLTEVYRACDRALGRLLERASAATRVMVFAVHGMGPNTAWADRCGDMLTRIQTGGPTPPPRRGALFTLKRMLPWRLTRAVTTRLPRSLQAGLVTMWSRRMYDWRQTRAFPLPMDHAGYIRINLRGREPEGMVERGAEYDALCAELAEGFLGFRDLASGCPIVRRVHRLDGLAPLEAPARERLPDLVIEWDEVSPIESPGIVSPRHGELRWSSRLPSGRAGNHRSHGWFVAAGPGIQSSSRADGHHIRDLVPTLLRWLGLDPGPELQGHAIEALCP